MLANDYNIGFGYGFIDSDLGCGKVLWKTHEGVGFCWWKGLWKSRREDSDGRWTN
jgi:hypothetical protein